MTIQRYLPPPPTQRLPVRIQSAGDDTQVRDLWMVLRRNVVVILGCLLAAIGAAGLFVMRATPVFRGETTIRIDDNLSTLPALDVLKELTAGRNEVSTEMEVLRSRTLVESVVDSLGLRMELLEPARTTRGGIFSLIHAPRTAPSGRFVLARGAGGRFTLRDEDRRSTVATVAVGQLFHIGDATLMLAPNAARESTIRFRLRPFTGGERDMPGELSVSRPSRDANVVLVRYESADSVLARDVPNALAYSFIGRRQVVKTMESHSTVQFLRRQLDTLSGQLAEAEDSLKAFREQARVVSLSDEATAQVQRLAQLQAERASLDEEHGALASLLAHVTTAAAHTRPGDPSPYRRMLAFPTLLRNQSVATLFQALTTVENERADLLIRRTPQDPDVMVLTNRVHELEEQVRSLGTTYLQGLGGQIASLDRQLAAYSRQLEQVPAKEVQFARLQRRPKVLEGVYTMLQSRLKEAQIAEAVADPSVRVVDAAIVPDRPVKPNKPLVLALGALLGLVLGAGISFLRESMDRGVHTREDVQRLTGEHVLALVPHVRSGAANRLASGSALRRFAHSLGAQSVPAANEARRGGAQAATPGLAPGVITCSDPLNPASEAYRSLRTSITYVRADQPPKVIVFTSPMSGDGKSTTAANLAVTLAEADTRVLLVDADLRRGLLHAVFGVGRDRGLSEVISGSADLQQVLRQVRTERAASFDFLSSGMLPLNPAELLGSARMRELLIVLRSRYEAIVMDSPPVNMVTDAAVLGAMSDGVILVVRAGRTSDADLAYAMGQIESVRAPLLGVVLNDLDARRDARYRRGYGYYEYHYANEAHLSVV